MNNDLLFVYGSLLDANNVFGAYFKQNAKYITNGFLMGRLYDCGEYPGAVADSNGYKIKGSIYQLRDAITALIILDDYEGFGIEQDQPNLFIRKFIKVTVDNVSVDCWIYLFNLSVDGLTEITSGDYMAYKQA